MANPNVVIPAISSLNLSTTMSDALCRYLDHAVEHEPSAKAAGVAYMTRSKSGPVLPLYSVNLNRLPLQTAAIIGAIKNGNVGVFNLIMLDWHNKEIDALTTEDKKN